MQTGSGSMGVAPPDNESPVMRSDRDIYYSLLRLNAQREGALRTYHSLTDAPAHYRLKTDARASVLRLDAQIMELLGGPENSEATLERLEAVEAIERDAHLKVTKAEQRAFQAKKDVDNIGYGFGLIILGGIVTLITYFFAPPGGKYVVMTGALIVGGFLITKGLLRIFWEMFRSWIAAKRHA